MTGPRKASVATGLGLMAGASLLVSGVDGAAKYLSEVYAPTFIAWARYAVAFCVVLPVALVLRDGPLLPRRDLALHGGRTICLVLAMTLFFVSLQSTDLATAIVAFFVGPVVALFLAVTLLGERLTGRILASLACGFAGVIVALQPGQDPGAGVLWALAAGLCLSVYLVATRLAGRERHPLRTLLFQCGFGALLLTPFAMLSGEVPQAGHGVVFLLMGGVSAGVHLMVIRAFQLAPASVLAPLVYLELLGAIVVGFVLFGDLPGPATLAGGALITLSGLLAWRAARAA
ncbi:DMT family transporter [Dinoroseobacter sp. S76]|uniref:DMT family transporter n=1 Tax=Dinoroseobacter sp. S76 TaxID=3415124 RepID=UPI003C7E570E